MAVADIHRVVQERLPVGADVEHHRDHPVGIDSGSGGVDSELADRDVHPIGAPVADPENLFSVCRHQQVDVVRAQTVIVKRGLDAVDVVDREVHPVGPLKLVAVTLDRLRHHGVIDDRQHLGEVIPEQLVVQDLVAIVQRRQEVVLRQIGRLSAVLLV